MKLSSIIGGATLALATSTSACLHAYGWIEYTGSTVTNTDIEVVDNGLLVCKSGQSLGPYWGWRRDQDGHVSLNCLPNYIWATNGVTAWYRNPVTAFSMSLNYVKTRVGGPNIQPVYRNTWDKWDFC